MNWKSTLTYSLSALFTGILSATSMADCGKIIIYKTVIIRDYVPPRPRPPYCPPVPPTLPPGWNDVFPEKNYGLENDNRNDNVNWNTNSNSVINNINIGSGQQGQAVIPVPEPHVLDGNVDQLASAGGIGSGVYGFEEPEQQAIVAWNGKTDDKGEEVLILTTNEKSLNKGGAMLSILPLPGEPLSISRANATAFRNAKALLTKKWDAGVGSGSFGVFMTAKIGPHNIFVWKMDDINTFEKDVKDYVSAKYEGGATALVTKDTLAVIKDYYDRGFRYFAFDLTKVDGKDFATKEAIAYHFKSNSAYFPLVISKIGGTGKTLVDLVVMTPGDLTRSPFYAIAEKKNNYKGEVRLNGQGTVEFSKEEFSGLDQNVANFFKDYDKIKVRNFSISGQINKFDKDFVMDNK